MAAFGGGNPFASGGNPFQGGGMGMLKKKPKVKSFEELEIKQSREEQWKRSATSRMREIDSYRLHVPEAEERNRWSIPESTDRVNLMDQQHLLVLCGGYAGVRFTSEELSFIRTSLEELKEKFSSLDNYFKSLPNTIKRIVLSEDEISRGVSSSLSEGKEEKKEQDKCVENKENNNNAVIAFHELADSVHDVLGHIQELVKKKHSEFSSVKDSSVDDITSQDGDEESLSSKPRPVWLETLLSKYNREVVNGNRSSTCASERTESEDKVAPPVPPIGSLCAFLSCCVIKQISTTKAEDEAMIELIQASNDFAAQSASHDSQSIDEEIFSHTQKYWAQRFFVFMKKLTELKTALKDEKSLYVFDKFYV